MEMEEPVFQMEHIEFCQCRPVFDGEDWIMVRDPRVSLAKDLITFKSLNNVADFDFLRCAIGDCGLSLTRGIPILQEYYLCLTRGATRKEWRRTEYESGMQFMAHGMDRKSSKVSTAARVSFWQAFGYTPEQQEAIENEYRTTQVLFSEAAHAPLHGVPKYD